MTRRFEKQQAIDSSKTITMMTYHTKMILRRRCPCRCPAVPARITANTRTSSVGMRRFKATTTSPSVVAGKVVAAAAESSSSIKSSSTSFGARLWQFYVRNLEARPLLTKSIFSSLIFFLSDSATQYILPPTTLSAEEEEDEEEDDEQKTKRGDDDDASIQFDTTSINTSTSCTTSFLDQWDAPRALSAAAFGVLATCYLHHWWNLLEFVLGRAIPIQPYRLANTMVKVVIDQGMAAPCYVYSYYTLTNFFQDLQEGKKNAATSWKETNAKASEMLWPTMMQHWKLWPMVHSLNFYYTPLHHRVLVQNCVLVGWSGYLSHLNHGSSLQINHHQKLLMTPDEEIKATILRRETEKRMQQKELQKSIP